MTASMPAARIRAEREARGWSQRDAVRALRMLVPGELPGEETLLRSWKRWEAGDHLPDSFYRPLIARLLGTVTASLFPRPPAPRPPGAALAAGMPTMEILARIRSSHVDSAVLDSLRITADQLCCDYPHVPSGQLITEGRAWLGRILGLLDRPMTLGQHREVLALAGLVALLVGCVENDMGDRRGAEATRRSALALGAEADERRVVGWAHEMSAWFRLTDGDYPGVIAAADAGIAAAGGRDVSVQLMGQKAKAYARAGDRRMLEVTLAEGRDLLERQPYPEDLTHHFVVDPAKWDFCQMDCYRITGQDELARATAAEVLRANVDPARRDRAPMRSAEARLTLGIVAARDGDLDQALSLGEMALADGRQSVPSLLMVGQEMAAELRRARPANGQAAEFAAHLDTLADG
ncbi:MAG: helix-turn-helix domain-containing protein [Streptosporangiaceae bacterium]